MKKIKFHKASKWETILEAEKISADVISRQQRIDLAYFLLKLANIKIEVREEDIMNFDGPYCQVYIGDYRVIEAKDSSHIFLLQKEVPIFIVHDAKEE